MHQSLTKSIVLIAATLFLSACGGQSLERLAENILYPFSDVDKKYPVPENPPEGLNQRYFDVKAHDGTDMSIHAWDYKNPKHNGRVLVYFHGNGMNLQTMQLSNLLTVFADLGFSYIVIDYPGLGRSTGTPNEPNLVNSGLAAFDWAKRSFRGSRIIVWGRSLGAAVAAQVAKQRQAQLGGLLLTSPWSTFYELALDKTSLASGISKEWLAMHTYDTVSAVSTLRKPSVVMHGDEDDLIPFKFGEAVFEAFPNNAPAEMLVLEGKEHNDVFQDSELWKAVRDFLK